MKTIIFLTIDFFKNFRLVPGGAACRFYPTCSAYAKEAVDKYGVFRGLWMGFSRLIRCHPLSKGGYDPVA